MYDPAVRVLRGRSRRSGLRRRRFHGRFRLAGHRSGFNVRRGAGPRLFTRLIRRADGRR
jgi:hypothetical protein